MSSPTLQPSGPARAWFAGATALVLTLAALKLALHLATANGYGIFRDELYFIVCGWHLDLGYVDHPPMVPLLARIGTEVFGVNGFAIRIFPALVGTALVILTAAMARHLGGGRFAQALAALTILAAPFYLGSQSKLATDSIEPLFWALCSLLLLLILRDQNPRLWITFGLAAGLGLLTKHSIVFFGFAITLALLLTPQRRLLLNRWFLLGGAAAALVALPHILWQIGHGLPTLELLANIKESGKNVVLSPVEFFLQQVLLLNPAAAPVWLAGVFGFLFAARFRQYRALGLTFLIVFVLMIALKAKNYYMGPIYPLYLAAGSVLAENWLRRRWTRAALAAPIVLLGLLSLPYTVPLLSPEQFLRYQSALGLEAPRTEHSHAAELPQNFADRFGWEQTAANVAAVYDSLSEADRARVAILAQNYGQAAAIDVHGRPFGLPPAISGHQSYYLWGPRGATGELMIVIDSDPESLSRFFERIEDRGPMTEHPYALPFERRHRIYLCHGLKGDLRELWPQLKNWI